MRVLWNVFAFQAGWFACVLGAANESPWLGVIAVVVLVVLHALLAQKPFDELRLIGSAALIGFVWETFLVNTGWLVYSSETPVAGLAPVWIVALWANFATTLNLSLHWLKGRWVLAAILGAVGGPLSYFAGATLGGAVFTHPSAAALSLAVGWAILMPMLVIIATRYNGMTSDVAPRILISKRV